MRASLWCTWVVGLALLSGGCMSGPWIDNPARVGNAAPPTSNPVYVPLNPLAYGLVFESVYNVVTDYFPEIATASRFDGRIETHPRIAPGLEQPWKPGSPDFQQRLLATFQTIRHRASVRIDPADDGGFFVDVKVFKELEDLPRPSRSTAGAASFRSDNTVERQFEVIDASTTSAGWIPLGRDLKLEQVILSRIACGNTPPPPPHPPATAPPISGGQP